MTTIGIGALLVTIAVPGMQAIAKRSKQRSSANELISAMHLARNTAITTNSRVTVCASESGADCEWVDWNKGYITFIDRNSDQKVDDDETIVRTGAAVEGLTIRSPEFSRFLMYRPNGRITAASANSNVGQFTICDESDSDMVKVVAIELSGRPHVIEQHGAGITPVCN